MVGLSNAFVNPIESKKLNIYKWPNHKYSPTSHTLRLVDLLWKFCVMPFDIRENSLILLPMSKPLSCESEDEV